MPPHRDAPLGGVELLLHAVARQHAVGARVQVQRLAVAAEPERNPAARIVGVVERRIGLENQIAAGAEHRPRGDLVPHPVVGIVAEEPAAQVDRLVRRVVQLDPVGHPAAGIGQDLVDHHRAQFGNHARIVIAGRAAGFGAGTPEALVVQRIGAGRPRLSDRQREARPIGQIVPVVLITEALDDLSGGIL